MLEPFLDGYPNKSYLVDGFRNGFSIGWQGQMHEDPDKNAKLVNSHVDVVHDMLKKEIDAGRIAGPFKDLPFTDYLMSPLSLRPKKEPGKFRLIHDLSFPYNHTSLNAGIPKSFSSVQYESVQHAIRLILKFGRGCFMSKTDIKSAFRLISIRPSEYCLFTFKFDGMFYFDRNLEMSCSSSCRIFEEFTTALHWVMINKLQLSGLMHFVDDFMIISPTKEKCISDLAKFQAFADSIGLPLAPEKTVYPDTTMVYLGVQLDSIKMESSISPEKIASYILDISEILSKDYCTLRCLQGIIGKLQWCCSIITPGRCFIRRLIDATKFLTQPYHRVTLTPGIRKDLEMWQRFFSCFNGKTLFMLDKNVHSDKIHFFSDASGFAAGAYYGTSWFVVEFPQSWLGYHITIKELYPIVLATYIFGKKLSNHKIIFHCDNQAVVSTINKQTSRNKKVMVLLRQFVLNCISFNVLFKSVHIAGKQNFLSDQISRLQINSANAENYGLKKYPERIPQFLQPQCWNLEV